jgi:hypothetical protein
MASQNRVTPRRQERQRQLSRKAAKSAKKCLILVKNGKKAFYPSINFYPEFFFACLAPLREKSFCIVFSELTIVSVFA